jgi:hypothetical protein
MSAMWLRINVGHLATTRRFAFDCAIFEKLNLENWKLGKLEAWVAVRPDYNKTNEKSNSIFFIFIRFSE